MISFGSVFRLSSFVNPCKSVLNVSRQSSPLLTPIAGAKSLEERVGLPPKPKRPLTPYFRFMQEIRPDVIKQNPEVRFTEIVKLIANKWESLDDAKKKKYEEEYKRDKIAFIEKLAKYDSKVPAEKKDELKQLRQEIAEAKIRRAMKKKVRELGKPKRPVSAFLLFLIEQKEKSPPAENEHYKIWHKRTVEKWSNLSDSQKSVYIESSRKELVKYKKQVSEWEAKMIRLGHIDVVRHDSLAEPAMGSIPVSPSPTKIKQKTQKSE